MLQFYETLVQFHYSLAPFVSLSISNFNPEFQKTNARLYIEQSHGCSIAIDVIADVIISEKLHFSLY